MELNDSLISILQEIKILTGVVLFELNSGLQQQLDIIKVFLLSHPQLEGLTLNEIRHAFYLNSQGEYDEVYRHYNKELNCEFLGDVLRAYIKYKSLIYKYHGRELLPLLNPPPAQKIILPNEQELRYAIQSDYDLFRGGRKEFIFLSDYVYKLLRDYGAIEIRSKVHWWILITKAMAIREHIGKSPLYRKDAQEKAQILELRDIYIRYRADGWIPRKEFRMVVHTMRKQMYLAFFRTMAAFKIKDIFTEITCIKTPHNI